MYVFTVNLNFTDLLFSLKKMLGEKEEGEREKTQIIRKQPAGYIGRGGGGGHGCVHRWMVRGTQCLRTRSHAWE